MRQDTERMRDALTAAGFTVGERDARLNRAFSGRYMVADLQEWDGAPTEDASNGPPCVVGDDLAELVEDAHANWLDAEAEC